MIPIALKYKPLKANILREIWLRGEVLFEALLEIAKSAPFGNGYLEKIEKCKTLYIK